MNDPRFRRLAAAAWLLLALIAAFAGPGTRAWAFLEGLPACLFRLLTGIPCPGCGMAHALVYALRGQWASSWRHHPLGLPLLLVWTAWLALPWIRVGPLRPFRGT